MSNNREISNVRILDVYKTLEITRTKKASVVSFYDITDGAIGIMLLLTAGFDSKVIVLDFNEAKNISIEDGNIFLEVNYGSIHVFADINAKWQINITAMETGTA